MLPLTPLQFLVLVRFAPGIPPSVDVYRVEKGCASGLKAVALAASSIALGEAHVALAAGVDSLSTAPHLLL